MTLAETEAEMRRLAELVDAVESASDSFEPFRLVGVDCVEIKRALVGVATARRDALVAKLVEQFHALNAETYGRFRAITDRLASDVETPEALDDQRRFAADAAAETETLRATLATSAATAEALERSGVALPDDVVDTYWNAITQPASVPQKLLAYERRAKELQKAMTETLKADIKANTSRIAEAKSSVHEFVELGDIDLAEDRLAAVEAMDARLAELKRAGEVYANREELFGRPVTTYPALNSLFREWEPYANLWRVCAEFGRYQPEWTNGPFPQLDPEKVTSMVETWNRAIVKMLKHIKGVPADVCAELKLRLAAFETNLPIVASLRNPGLRDRHWKDMSEDLGFAVKADAEFSLARAVQLGLHRHIDVLEKYSEAASKEYSLERALDSMHQNWRGVEFETSPWRDTGSFVLKGTDETQMLLDDQIVKTQSMRSSPYIGPFEDRVKLWEKKLTTIQEVLDQWLKMQSGWLYLEPIFGSDDIMQQMPAEGRKFKTVDTTWRKTMLKLELTSEVLVVGADEDLLGSLRKCNELLDEVNKGLSEYLETKRLAFPRFYFLSNDELLEILSETKDPLRVQPFLKKVFEAIHLLEFQKNMEVTAMLSEEGEKVTFVNSFNPAKAGGAVEKWLIQCEAAQRETVAAMCRDASKAYATSKRTDWMMEWPGQVVLCIGSLYWTSQTEAAIREGTVAAHASTVSAQLMEIVEKVRGKLTKLQRKTLSALVVLEVHARDVVAELAEKGVPSVEDFDWASQLRYTWDTMDDGKDGVTVRMINAAIAYGNEYLGNSSRLVITPLTDRCYRTLMGAVHLDVGGAPEGPAGTGKTETTKDLAKAIAMQCVVFNCSDGLDYLAMAKFFKGLAASGAWACFDEFNRIDLEVLSVIAQQILTITRAKAARALVFDFEGTRLPLRRTCNVFITMNPGYAGRSELPDNLKALFRTVAMMVPDYAMISEVFLFSNGYLEARSLAVKLVATYKLCSEQLSSQSHYDYGMRAVISVLRAAGAVKLKYPERDESVLMLISLKDVNLPKFLAPDVPLFNNILSDLFPGVELPEPDYDHMRASLELECARRNLQPTPVFLEKIFQLYEMILVRHGLMIVGYSYGAKTCMYRTLAGALGDLNSKGLLEENKVKVVVINPKSIYMGQLYGQFDPVARVAGRRAREEVPRTGGGHLARPQVGDVRRPRGRHLDREHEHRAGRQQEAVLDVRRDHRHVQRDEHDLRGAGPGGGVPGDRLALRHDLRRAHGDGLGAAEAELDGDFARDPQAALRSARGAFAWLVEPCLRFVRKNCKELVPTSDINLPVALMNIFESMIDEFRVGEDEAFAMSDKDQRVFVDCSFAFAVVWSIGGTTDGPGRKKFDDFFRKLVDKRVDEKPERADYDLGPGWPSRTPTTSWPRPSPRRARGACTTCTSTKRWAAGRTGSKSPRWTRPPYTSGRRFWTSSSPPSTRCATDFCSTCSWTAESTCCSRGPPGRGRRCTSKPRWTRATRPSSGTSRAPSPRRPAPTPCRTSSTPSWTSGARVLRPAHRKPRRGVCGRPQHARARGVRRAAAHRARAPVLRPRRLVRPRRALHAAAGGRAVRRGDGPARGGAQPHHAAHAASLQPRLRVRLRRRLADAGVRANRRLVVPPRGFTERRGGQDPELGEGDAGDLQHHQAAAAADAVQEPLHVQHARPVQGVAGREHGGQREKGPGRRCAPVGARVAPRVPRPTGGRRRPDVVLRLREEDGQQALRLAVRQGVRAPGLRRQRVRGHFRAAQLDVRRLLRRRGKLRRGDGDVAAARRRGGAARRVQPAEQDAHGPGAVPVRRRAHLPHLPRHPAGAGERAAGGRRRLGTPEPDAHRRVHGGVPGVPD